MILSCSSDNDEIETNLIVEKLVGDKNEDKEFEQFVETDIGGADDQLETNLAEKPDIGTGENPVPDPENDLNDPQEGMSNPAEDLKEEDIQVQEYDDDPMDESSNQIEELTFTNTEILNTDVNCEEFDTHVYCISKTAPVAKKYPKWGILTGYSPEVFCSTDLPLLVCTETTKSLLAAMMEWGSYGNAEYWILGSDKASAKNLTDLNCQRRKERYQMRLFDCEWKHGPNGDHGFESYRLIGEESIRTNQPRGSAGLNGNRGWGFHYFTSSIPIGLTDYFPYIEPWQEQKLAFHEYFHAFQHSFIETEDYDKRDKLLGPVWFNEGGAEYMAHIGFKKSFDEGILSTPIKEDTTNPYDFKDAMRNKLEYAKISKREVCPNLDIGDMSYQNDCNGASYDLGTWAHILLESKTATPNILVDKFYPILEENGWEEAFNKTYGISPEEFYVEFNEFINMSTNDQITMLDKIISNYNLK